MKKLGAKRIRDGTLLLDFHAFCKALGVEAGEREKGEGGGKGADKASKDRDWEGVSEELTRQLRRRPKALQALREALVQLDRKGKGRVSREDMRFALDQADLLLGSKSLRCLMDRYASEADQGCVDFARLLSALTPQELPAVVKVRDALLKGGKGEKRLRALFGEYDRGGKGKLSRREFRLCLEEAGVELGLDDMKALLTAFEDPENEAMVDAEAFLDAAFGGKGGAKGAADGADDPLEALLAKIRAELKKEGQRPTCVRPKLERADERAKGYVSRKQLERVLEELELDLDKKELGLLHRAFDRRRDETVAYMDFCDRLEGPKDKEGGKADVAEDTMDYLMELLRRAGEKGVDLLECFEHFDANRDGNIDEEEFREGLKRLDIRLSKRQVKEVMEKFEGRRPGTCVCVLFVIERYHRRCNFHVLSPVWHSLRCPQAWCGTRSSSWRCASRAVAAAAGTRRRRRARVRRGRRAVMPAASRSARRRPWS
jgi:Ca2+-binding EF-hand superfamily protein